MIQSIELRIPFFQSYISAGFPSPANDYVEEKIDLNKLLIRNTASTFLINVDGDSMIDFHIPPRSKLLIDRSKKPKDGDIVVAVINGELTVKQLLYPDGTPMLSAGNVRYKPIYKPKWVLTNLVLSYLKKKLQP